ncbi:AAA family ATPase [Stutzerimonas tarimensis]|uniref:AAA family ATPase n=1 Tax=Stutzerimonas tarimensis TaxID=1507735 RepID=A0ABV7T5V0_9GAMM
MKILAIRLKNLASLAGEQLLDFTAEPLASAGLFAITGPTGAGKSTLLDALCLALFGSTPRLQGSTSGKVPDAGDEIGSGDERNLLRRGCSSGYAEVDFIGIDGRRYRARWEARRARDKASGKLQASQQSLIELDTGTSLARTKGEFRQQLEERLGLTLAQFTRAVLLAQSEFAAFLRADDNERGTLLEKLTDTGLYSRLGQAAFESARSARETLAQLEQQAGGSRPLEPEARAELEARHEALQGAWKAEQNELRSLESQRQWLDGLARLSAERETAAGQLSEAEAAGASLAEARRILTLSDQLAPQRHRFVRQRELGPLIEQASQTLRRGQAEQASLETRRAVLQQRCEEAGLALQSAEQHTRDAAPALAQARREEDRLAQLGEELAGARQEQAEAEQANLAGEGALAALGERLQQASHGLAQLSEPLAASAALQPLCASWSGYRPRLQHLVQLLPRLAQGTAELPALERAAALAESAQQTAHRALDELQRQLGDGQGAGQLGALGERLESLRERERDHQALGEYWNRHRMLLARQQQLHATQRDLLEQRETLTETGRQARAERDRAEQALTLVLALLERQRLARSADVQALRAALQPGEPCLVCGSADHPWHAADVLAAALDSRDEAEAERARQSLKAQDEALQSLRDQLTTLNTRLRDSTQRQEEIVRELEPLAAQLQASPLHASLLAQPAERRDAWLSETLDSLRRQREETAAGQQALLRLQQRAEALQRDWQTAREACIEATSLRDRQREAIARDRQLADETLAEFAPLLPPASLEHWHAAAAESFMRLEVQVDERQRQLEAQARLAEEQLQRQAELERERLEQGHRRTRLASSNARVTELVARERSCRQALQALLGTRPDSRRWQAELDQTLQVARDARSAVDQQLNEARVTLSRLESERGACQVRHEELLAERGQIEAELNRWRAGHPELDDATLEQLLQLDDRLLDEARERLAQNNEALARCRERLQERTQRLAAHQALQPQPIDGAVLAERLAERLATCQQAELHCSEARAALLDDDRRRSLSRTLDQQIAAAKAESQRWGRIASLIGSADGNAFRKIAQAYNLDLLVQHTNVQLRQLARRYRLKRGGSPLGLLVMDTEMGDELRSVHSLSGGETFLVSLALALGLASMASSKLRIESLFIDEGFGSLDPESLQVAMDALDALQAQGRKVAVISHVAEMHERIPVQVRVCRQGNGQSRLEIKG